MLHATTIVCKVLKVAFYASVNSPSSQHITAQGKAVTACCSNAAFP